MKQITSAPRLVYRTSAGDLTTLWDIVNKSAKTTKKIAVPREALIKLLQDHAALSTHKENTDG